MVLGANSLTIYYGYQYLNEIAIFRVYLTRKVAREMIVASGGAIWRLVQIFRGMRTRSELMLAPPGFTKM